MFALLSCLCFSCGKKAEENDHSNDRKLTYSEAEVNFYVSQDIKKCVETNDHQQLRKLLSGKNNLKLNELGHDGETLLTKAIFYGHVAVARVLIEAGASVNVSNINNETPLIIAVNKKLQKFALELIALEADINKKDIFGDTALILAIKSRQEELAITLIENGADIFQNDRYSRSAYTLSQQYELKTLSEIIKLILEERFGEPSLEEFRSQILEDEFRYIVRSLSRFNHLAVQYEDINPLALLSYRSNEDEIIEGAKLFLRWGVRINGPKDVQTNPPLIEAMINLKFRYVDFLIERNADVNKLSTENLPPLYYAIELNEPELVSKLNARGANKKTETFDACSFAKKLHDEFSQSSEKEKNKRIRKLLSCGFFIWP